MLCVCRYFVYSYISEYVASIFNAVYNFKTYKCKHLTVENSEISKTLTNIPKFSVPYS